MSRHPLHPSFLVAVAIGAAAGACLRHAAQSAFPASGTSFPWAVFAINVSGALLLALLPGIPMVRRHPLLPPLLGTGVLGGFTTFSTYSEQTRALLAEGAIGTATLYLVGTLGAALAAVAVASRLSDATARAEFEDEEGDE